ncbi:MAG: alpha/beta fold hydrolase [Cyclobacteriaceae bacterium]
MKILKRVLIALAVLIAIVYSFLCWTLSDRVLFPTSSMEKTKGRIVQLWGTTYEASMEIMPEYKDFSVKTIDGLQLKGRYFMTSDSSSCAIIFLHGWGAIWADMLKYVPAFDDCNCDYVMYDHRAHGESEGKYATGGFKEAEDLWQVTNWVQENYQYSLSEIGWIGSSWGAATSLIAGAEEKDVGFIIADSPFQDWKSAVFERAIRDYGSSINMIAPGVMRVAGFRAGLSHREASPLNKASAITEPVLLIHSKTDSQTSSSQSINISKNLNSVNSTFYNTDWGNDHVMDVVKNTEDYRAYILDFLTREAPQFLK